MFSLLTSGTRTLLAESPGILFHPRDETVVLYQQSTLGVIADGTAPLSYQWFKEGVPIAGATNDQVVIPQTQFSDAGTYSVTVSNTEDEVTSGEARLTVHAPKAGDLDGSFAYGGSINGAVRAVAIQPNGKILIGGEFTTVHGAVRGGIARLNSDGTTDHTFRDGLAHVGGHNRHVNSVAVQRDGKVVIASHFNDVIGDYRPSLERLNADGTLDNSFSGRLAGDLGFGSLTAVVIQPDDKILICGGFQLNGKNYEIGRVNVDGSFDQTFASNISPLTAVWAVRVQPDHKILIAGGFTSIDGHPRSGIARLNSDGSLDLGFDPRISSSASGGVLSVDLLDDGKVVIGGYFSQVNGATRHSIARLHTDGTLDTVFIPAFPNPTTHPGWDQLPSIFSLALQPDGGVVLGGNFLESGAESYTSKALRLNPDASVDESFPGAIFQSSRSDWTEIYAVVTQADGKTLIGGKYSTANGQKRYGIARLTQAGALDDGFLNPISGIPGASTLLLEANDKILLGGGFGTVHGITRTALARLDADGHLDQEQPEGLSQLTGGELVVVSALAPQIDGKLVVGGWFYSTEPQVRGGNRILRLNADATLDSSFTIVSLGLFFDVGYADINSLVVQPDGKILVAGWFQSVNGVRRPNWARLNPDGTLDSPEQSGPLFPPTSASIFLQGDGKVLLWKERGTLPDLSRLNPDDTLNLSFRPPSYGQVAAIVQQSDGKLIVVGELIAPGSLSRTGVARLNPDGTLDASFQNGLFEVGRSESTFVHTIALQPDGKIIVSGDFDTRQLSTRDNGALVRLNADGTLDHNFNADVALVSAMAVQSDGRVVIAGNFSVVNGMAAQGIARLWGSADVPPSLRSLNRSATESVITWDALPERRYRVQYDDSISAGSWIDLPGDVVGSSSGTASKADSDGATTLARFYRVVLLPD